MKGLEDLNLSGEGRSAQRRDAQSSRAVGGPLPIGGVRSGFSQAGGDARNPAPPPPGRALTNAPDQSSGEQLSSSQRAMNVLKMAMPLMQRILPLLDGNFGTAISNVLTQQMHKPAPPVNLAPIEHGLAELQTQQRDLRDQVVEQNTSLKRVEDHLEMVREATDRNTLEQQELLEDLKAVGNKVNLVAIIALGLLVVSLFLNLFLYLHIERVLP